MWFMTAGPGDWSNVEAHSVIVVLYNAVRVVTDDTYNIKMMYHAAWKVELFNQLVELTADVYSGVYL